LAVALAARHGLYPLELGPKRETRSELETRPAILFAAARADTTSTVANWVLGRHFATKDFFRAVQEI